MVFIVPAMPHKPWWRRLRLGAWCARVAMTYTLPASILGPVQRALFLRERRAFTTELLAPRTQKLDCASRARRLRVGRAQHRRTQAVAARVGLCPHVASRARARQAPPQKASRRREWLVHVSLLLERARAAS